jgi:hypothetical protein
MDDNSHCHSSSQNNGVLRQTKDKLRVCRRCFSRIMSCESSFGRHDFSTKHLFAIVAWLGLPAVGRVYTLNVKWHGIMSSRDADEHIWGGDALRRVQGRSSASAAIANPTALRDIQRNLPSLEELASRGIVQRNRHAYFFEIGLQNLGTLHRTLSKSGFLGREAARALTQHKFDGFHHLPSSFLNVDVVEVGVVGAEQVQVMDGARILPVLVANLGRAYVDCRGVIPLGHPDDTHLDSQERLHNVLDRIETASYSARALTMVCGARHAASSRSIVKSIVLCGALDELLRIAGRVSRIDMRISQCGPVAWNRYAGAVGSLLAQTTGALLNLAALDGKTPTSERSFVSVPEYFDALLAVFRCRFTTTATVGSVSLEVNAINDVCFLQAATNCCGALAVCCGLSHEARASLPGSGIVALLLLLMDKLWVVRNAKTVHASKRSAATKCLRAACTALRNAMLKSSECSCQQAIQKEFCQAGGIQTVLRMLVEKSNDRVAEKAAAVLTNATDGSVHARRWIFETDLSCMLKGIGCGHAPVHSSCWEFCAGAIRNLTVGGAMLEDQASHSLCATLLQKIALLCDLMANGATRRAVSVQRALVSLCGALCNLSLISDNAAVLESHGTRVMLAAMVSTLPDASEAIQYAEQALQNLDHHASYLAGAAV